VQRKRTSEVCSGRGHQRCAEGESTWGVQRERASEVCT
jgi:hypothetical protein